MVSWRALLGRLMSLCHLVPGVGFVFALSNFVFESVAIVDESVSVAWTDSIRSDLQWWSDAHNILVGVSLATPPSDHYFWSDASDQGWGVRVGVLLSPTGGRSVRSFC